MSRSAPCTEHATSSFSPLREGAVPRLRLDLLPLIENTRASAASVHASTGVHPCYVDHDVVHESLAAMHNDRGQLLSFAQARQAAGLDPNPVLPPTVSVEEAWLTFCHSPRALSQFFNVRFGDQHIQATARSLEKSREVLGNGLLPMHPRHLEGSTKAYAQGRAMLSALLGAPGRILITTAKPNDMQDAPCAVFFGGKTGYGGATTRPTYPVVVVHHDDKARIDLETATLTSSVDVLVHELAHAVDHLLDTYDLRGGVPIFHDHPTYDNSTEAHATFAQMASSHAAGGDLQRVSYGEQESYRAQSPYSTVPEAFEVAMRIIYAKEAGFAHEGPAAQ